MAVREESGLRLGGARSERVEAKREQIRAIIRRSSRELAISKADSYGPFSALDEQRGSAARCTPAFKGTRQDRSTMLSRSANERRKWKILVTWFGISCAGHARATWPHWRPSFAFLPAVESALQKPGNGAGHPEPTRRELKRAGQSGEGGRRPEPDLRRWQGYFGNCETLSVLDELDAWIRRRLRSVETSGMTPGEP